MPVIIDGGRELIFFSEPFDCIKFRGRACLNVPEMLLAVQMRQKAWGSIHDSVTPL